MGLKEDIQRTIGYAKKFGCPINEKEICERLISKKIYDLKEIKKELKNFKIDNNKNKWVKIKIKKAQDLAKLLGESFKNIKMIGITGSVAAGYPKKNDDIDLMIITKKNKLWITRFKLRWFIFMNKIPHRKYDQKENKDEFCFNFWLDNNNLLLPKKRQNLRSAMDLILMKPILNQENTYERFILKNKWAEKYLATGYDRKISNFQFLISNENKDNYLDEIINKLFFWPQYWYMKRKITNEKIDYHQAFFYK